MTNPTDCPAATTRRDPFALIEPGDESAALAARLDQWRQYHGPAAGYPEWVMARVVVASIRLDRNLAHKSALRVYEAGRARLSWDDDRRLDAEDLAAKLPGDPARVRRGLEQSLQGADWLIERWDALARIAGSGRAWSDPERSLALDLLGIPLSLRDGPAPVPTPAESQAALALSEHARLVRLCERVLISRDESERSLAVSGLSLSFSPAMLRLHRHEALWSREFHRAFSEFRRTCRRPTDDTPAPRWSRIAPPSPPDPASLPAPDPTRSASAHDDLPPPDFLKSSPREGKCL